MLAQENYCCFEEQHSHKIIKTYFSRMSLICHTGLIIPQFRNLLTLPFILSTFDASEEKCFKQKKKLLTHLQISVLNLDQLISFSDEVENIETKEEITNKSNFIYCCNVFKSPLLMKCYFVICISHNTLYLLVGDSYICAFPTVNQNGIEVGNQWIVILVSCIFSFKGHNRSSFRKIISTSKLLHLIGRTLQNFHFLSKDNREQPIVRKI